MIHPIHQNNTIYFESISTYPNDHRGVKWTCAKSQFLRFKILCEIASDLFNSRVLDVGCGLGHLVDYLIDKHFEGEYKGIDLVYQMIQGATKRHPTFDFETNDIDSVLKNSFDYVLASGIFTFSNWENMQEIVPALFDRATKGLAFNCLSPLIKLQDKESEIFYPNPTDVFDFCCQITPKVTLRHDYLQNDFTIYMYK